MAIIAITTINSNKVKPLLFFIFLINTLMKYDKLQIELGKMIDVNMPIIAIQDHDFVRVDELIRNSVGAKAKIEEWNPGTKRTNYNTKQSTDVDKAKFPSKKQEALSWVKGLKENVIIGRLIPAGTGLREYDKLVVAAKDELDNLQDFVELPSYCDIQKDRKLFANAYNKQADEQDPIRGKILVQKGENEFIVQNPPAEPLTEKEMDAIYDIEYHLYLL